MDETLARQHFGLTNAVGKRYCEPDDTGCPGEHGIEVVGVVKDVRSGTVDHADLSGTLYEPSWSNAPGSRWLEVRFAGSAAPVIAGVRHALQEQDPNVPLLRVRMMKEYVNSQLARQRLTAYLSGFFGILALGLTAVGLYGVVAYVVTQRTREIGIRMALGASRRDVVTMIGRVALVPVAVGIILGLGASFAWSLLFGSLLYGVDTFGLESPLVAVAAISAAALLACLLPARRATKVDPLVALRYE